MAKTSKWKVGLIGAAVITAAMFANSNLGNAVGLSARIAILSAMGKADIVEAGQVAPERATQKSTVDSWLVGMTSSNTFSGMKNIASAWSDQAQLRHDVLGANDAYAFQAKHKKIGENVRNISLAAGANILGQEDGRPLRNFAPDAIGPKPKYAAAPKEKPMNAEVGRVVAFDALANEALHKNAYFTAIAIPQSDKSVSSFPESERPIVEAARKQAAAVFRKTFVSATVSLASKEQSEYWGLPSKDDLKAAGFPVIDVTKILAASVTNESQFDKIEMALSYAARASQATYKQTLNTKTLKELSAVAHYPDQPAMLYDNYAELDADEMKISPSAVVRVSQHWIKNNPEMKASAPKALGIGWREALGYDQIKATAHEKVAEAAAAGPSEAQKVALKEFREHKKRMLSQLDAEEAKMQKQMEAPALKSNKP